MTATPTPASRSTIGAALVMVAALVHPACSFNELAEAAVQAAVGAATTDKYVGSWPQPPYGPDMFFPGATAVIYGPGFSLKLQLQNHRRKLQVPYEPPLGVLIQFDPEDDSFLFDPREVVLVDPAGRSLEPTGFLGPGVTLSPEAVPEQMINTPCGLPGRCFNCDVRPFRKDEPPFAVPLPPGELPAAPIPVRDSACFVLFFDADPEGKGSLELTVGGIRRKDRRIDVPGVTWQRLAKGRF